jgi:GTPase SAR1 family protein
MTPLYYRESRVCIIVYDTTSRKSFEAVERWLQDVRNTVDPNTLIVVAGTKLDRVDQRVISYVLLPG